MWAKHQSRHEHRKHQNKINVQGEDLSTVCKSQFETPVQMCTQVYRQTQCEQKNRIDVSRPEETKEIHNTWGPHKHLAPIVSMLWKHWKLVTYSGAGLPLASHRSFVSLSVFTLKAISLFGCWIIMGGVEAEVMNIHQLIILTWDISADN